MTVDELHTKALADFNTFIHHLELEKGWDTSAALPIREMAMTRGLDQIGPVNCPTYEELTHTYGSDYSEPTWRKATVSWKSGRTWIVARDEGVEAAMLWKLRQP